MSDIKPSKDPSMIYSLANGLEDSQAYSKNLSLDDLFSVAPLCESTCTTSNHPCAKIDSNHKGPQCSSALFFRDHSGHAPKYNSYCPSGYVCCFSSLCRPRLLKCKHDSSHVRSILDKMPIPQAVQDHTSHASPPSPQIMNAFLTYERDADNRDKSCTQSCNGFFTRRDDIFLEDCPKSCRCKVVQQVEFLAREKWPCAQELQEKETKRYYWSYSQGDLSVLPMNKTICPINYACTNSARCVSYEDYQRYRLAYWSSSLIFAGCILFIVLFMKSKWKRRNHPNYQELESLNETYFKAM